MKTFALAALAAFGLAFTAGTADAQIRYRSSSNYSTNRGSVIYSTPSYGSSAIYNYPSSGYSSLVPTYNSGVITNYYTPTYDTVVTPAGFSPAYSPNYYPSTYSGYTYPSYYGGSYVAPAGGIYRGRGWRW